MLRFSAALLLLGAAAVGCSPTFNWREVRAAPTSLQALLPCKPERAVRQVPMAGRDVEISALGCETGGATFAILFAALADPATADQVLVQWNGAALANLQASEARAQPFRLQGALDLPAAQRVSALGRRSDGSPVRSEAAYFARGTHVYQALVVAADPRVEWVQPFFEGLKFP